jgi:hypothetical protein
MKSIKADVQLVVEHLVATLGGTWQGPLVARVQKDSKLVNPPRLPQPWVAVARLAASGEFDGWMKGHLDSKVTWM